MKSFKDFKFTVMNHGVSGIGGIMEFNGYEISIIMTETSYGGNKGLWEMAVFKKDDWKALHMICFKDADVCGFLNSEEVENKLIEVQKELERKMK